MRTNLAAADVSAVESTALSLLFARFVKGEISETSWTQMMSVLDEGATNAEERAALANFFSDACSELGPDAVEVPALGEMNDYVTLLRAA